MSGQKRLRVAHLVIQPILVWDDGEHLEPGPPAEPVNVAFRDLEEFGAHLLAELAQAQASTGGSPQPARLSTAAECCDNA